MHFEIAIFFFRGWIFVEWLLFSSIVDLDQSFQMYYELKFANICVDTAEHC